MTRTVGTQGIFLRAIEDADGKPYTRKTRLLYTNVAKSIDSYAVYIDSFCNFFSDYSFPKI